MALNGPIIQDPFAGDWIVAATVTDFGPRSTAVFTAIPAIQQLVSIRPSNEVREVTVGDFRGVVDSASLGLWDNVRP